MIYLGLIAHRTLHGRLCSVRGCGRPAQRWCTFLLCGNVHAVAMCLEHGEVSEVSIARLTGEPDAMPESAEERQKRRAYDRRRMALSGRG